MTDEFTNISFCVFMNHERKKCNLVKKRTQIDRSLSEKKKKKKKEKKNLAHFFSDVVGVVHVSISGVVSCYSLSLPVGVGQSNFFRVVFVHLKKRNNRFFTH